MCWTKPLKRLRPGMQNTFRAGIASCKRLAGILLVLRDCRPFPVDFTYSQHYLLNYKVHKPYMTLAQ
jgi:hypothetical protein